MSKKNLIAKRNATGFRCVCCPRSKKGELAQIFQKIFRRALVEARKDFSYLLVPQMVGDGLTQYLPEIRGYCQVASFIKVFGLETGPAAIHSAALHGNAQNKHH